VPLGLLAGVDIDLMAAILAPDAQQQVRLRRGAERRRAGFIFPAFLSHIPTMPPMLWP